MDQNEAMVFWMTLFFSGFFLKIFEQKWLDTWKVSYYKKGIPLFKKSFAYVGSLSNEIDVNILSDEFKDKKGASFAFHALSSNEVAFHQRQFKSYFMNYVIIMHGFIQVDRLKQEVVMTGNANLFPIWFLMFFKQEYNNGNLGFE